VGAKGEGLAGGEDIEEPHRDDDGRGGELSTAAQSTSDPSPPSAATLAIKPAAGCAGTAHAHL